MFYVYIKR